MERATSTGVDPHKEEMILPLCRLQHEMTMAGRKQPGMKIIAISQGSLTIVEQCLGNNVMERLPTFASQLCGSG